MNETMTENGIREIVHLAAGGDRDAMKKLMRGITSDMYFVTRLFVGDRDTARSSEESALRNALGRLKESEEAESFEQWISKIVRDEAVSRVLPLDVFRIEDLPYTSADEYGSPENIIAYTEEECRVRILHVLDELKPAERLAAALHFYEHMTPAEIGSYLDISEDQAKTLLTMAKQTIRRGDIDLHTFTALTNRVNPAPEPVSAPVEETVLPSFDLDESDTMELAAQSDEDTEDRILFTDDINLEELQKQEPKLLQDTSVYERNSLEQPEETPAPAPVKEPAPVTIVDDDEYEDEDDESGHGGAFLKILLALLLMAAACGGVYWWLFMRNANQADNNKTEPSAVVDNNTDDKTDAETPDSGEKTDEGSQETPAPAPEPAPEPAPAAFDPNAVIGTAHINVAGIPIHTADNEASETVGEAVAGADYYVYAVRTDGADTWYRLDENEWIDTEEGWVTYTEGAPAQ